MPSNTSTAKGYAAFFLDSDMTSLSFMVTVTGLDFTGSQTADPSDDLLAAHIHAAAPRGTNAGVRFGFFGTPFNDTNPNDVVVTPFAGGVGGTVTSKWDLREGNNTTLAAQLPNILAGQSYINFHTRRLPGGEIRGQIEENPEVTANIHKIFGYGFRNSFGFDFDPESGALWLQENADDASTEVNLVEPGLNGGWIQLMGPVARYQEFRFIEQTMFGSALQQVRWPPSRLAPTVEEALARLVMFPGAHYSDPEFSWKFEIAPAGMGFQRGRALGPQYEGDLFLGAARDSTAGPANNTFGADGFLVRFNLTGNRRKIAIDDPRLEDRVADNLTKHEITESESLIFGTGFGVGTDILTGPNGNLYVVSLTKGSVFEVFRKSPPGRSGPNRGRK